MTRQTFIAAQDRSLRTHKMRILRVRIEESIEEKQVGARSERDDVIDSVRNFQRAESIEGQGPRSGSEAEVRSTRWFGSVSKLFGGRYESLGFNQELPRRRTVN